MRGPKRAATGDPQRRVIVALIFAMMVTFVTCFDPPLIALAVTLAADLIIMLTQAWVARRSEAGSGRPCMHARALPEQS
jgi:hypothetical protein